MVQSATTAVQDLDGLILGDSTSRCAQSRITLWPLLRWPAWPFFSESPFVFPPFIPLFCLFHLTFLTHSFKLAWHASHCLTKVCVCGRCLGRLDLLWDTLISSKPRHQRGGTGQVSGNTRYTSWLSFSVRVRSAPFFMPESLLQPGVPNHLASVPGRWSLPGSLWGRKQWAAVLPREPPDCAFCQALCVLTFSFN